MEIQLNGNRSAARCVRLRMDSVIDYVFGTGDGHTTTWEGTADADPDGDGTDEAIWLDFDGDGRRDDLLWDTDGDGVADVAALDLDDDGRVDDFYRDRGDGVWGISIARPDGQPDDPANSGPGTTGSPQPGTEPEPSPQSQTSEPATTPPPTTRVLDLDGDGTTDAELVVENGVVRRLYLDDDGDGRLDRVLVDLNGDGVVDVTYDEDAPEFGR